MRSNNNNKKEQGQTTKIVVRIIAIILCAMFILSGLIAIFPFVNAASYTVFNSEDTLIRVGIFYSSSGKDYARESLRVRTDTGVRFYKTTEKNEITYIYTLHKTDLSFCVDTNLVKTGSGSSEMYSFSSSNEKTVGCHHIEVATDYSSESSVDSAVKSFASRISSYSVNVYPAYINGKFKVHIGQYFTANDASIALELMSSAIGTTASVVSPTDTSMSIIDFSTGRTVLNFDTGNEYGLGVAALQERSSESYLKTSAGNIYNGIFEYRVYRSGSFAGVQLVMINELEAYVESVVPYEISSSWNIEVLKAMAVTARTYAISAIRSPKSKHKTLGFDICDSSDCQVSLGRSRITDSVIEAVSSTKGELLSSKSDGSLITSYYSAIGGGCSAAGNEVWNMGKDIPYLQGIQTPWEKYENYSKGSWTFTVDASELCQYLRADGYTTLKDKIADITIDKLCTNSSYVYQITIKDIHGNSKTFTRASNVKSVLSDYLYSANFIIDHNGKLEGITDGYRASSVDGELQMQVMTSNGEKKLTSSINSIMTENGLNEFALSGNISVITGSNTISYDALGNEICGISSINSTTVNGDDKFIFIGKGYGHGVGMSQNGAKDMADAGADYKMILQTYYQQTEIVNK